MSNMECKCQIPNTDLAGRCFKCGGVINTQPPMSNNQLPTDVQERIKADAAKYIDQIHCHVGDMEYEAYIAGATEYATKLHEAEEKIKNRDAKIELLLKARQGESESVDKMIDLLTEVFTKHESGLLPDRFIYEKIKCFLYGE